MKKMITLLVLVLGVVTANAQKLSFPTAWEQYRNQMTFLRSESHGNDMWRDIYLYNGNEFYNEGHCPTCKEQQPINVDNSNTVITYDREIEMANLIETRYANDINSRAVDAMEKTNAIAEDQLMLNKKTLRLQRWDTALDFTVEAVSGAGDFMLGLAGVQGKLGTNVNQYTNVYGSTTTSQGGSGSDADGINPDGTTTLTQEVIDYTLLNQSQNQGGNGGDQNGIFSDRLSSANGKLFVLNPGP